MKSLLIACLVIAQSLPVAADDACKAAREDYLAAVDKLRPELEADIELLVDHLDKCSEKYFAEHDRQIARDKILDPLIAKFADACKDDSTWGKTASEQREQLEKDTPSVDTAELKRKCADRDKK